MVVVSICLTASAASAQSIAVVLVRPDAADAQLADAFNRLHAELQIHGFETRVRDTAPAQPSADLTTLLEGEDAVAAFGLLRDGSEAWLDIVLAPHASSGPTTRRLSLERGADAASLIAVRAVDLLRSTLQEFPAPASEPAEPRQLPAAEPPPAAAAPAPVPEEHTFSFAVEGTMLWPGQRFGLGFGPAVGMLHHPWPSLRWGLWLAGPVLGMRLETPSGDAVVRQGVGFMEARLVVLRSGRFELGPLVGGGVYLLQASGRVDAPLRSEEDGKWSGLVAVGVHAEQGLGARFALRLSVRALGLVPGLGVAIAREQTEFALPVLQMGLGVAVRF